MKDLLDTRYTHDLGKGARLFDEYHSTAGLKPPSNRGKAHFRDAAVINWWLQQLADGGQDFQTVRCAFPEGDLVHPEMTLFSETHIQIAVRDPSCIHGVFVPTGAG